MRTKIAALALLGASLLFMPLANGPAQAASALGLVDAVGSGTPDASLLLVRNGGGGGGGGFSAGGGGGGGMGHVGGGGGGMGHVGGGGGGAPHFSGGGGAPHMSGGVPHGSGRTFAGQGGGANYHAHPYSGPHPYTGPRYAKRDFNHGAPQHDRYGHYNNRHYAERGHDHSHSYRHRVWRNGAWVWVYGPGYYGPDYYAYGGECYWLRQQAYATGSPYWWSRYNACLGYY